MVERRRARHAGRGGSAAPSSRRAPPPQHNSPSSLSNPGGFLLILAHLLPVQPQGTCVRVLGRVEELFLVPRGSLRETTGGSGGAPLEKQSSFMQHCAGGRASAKGLFQ